MISWLGDGRLERGRRTQYNFFKRNDGSVVCRGDDISIKMVGGATCFARIDNLYEYKEEMLCDIFWYYQYWDLPKVEIAKGKKNELFSSNHRDTIPIHAVESRITIYPDDSMNHKLRDKKAPHFFYCNRFFDTNDSSIKPHIFQPTICDIDELLPHTDYQDTQDAAAATKPRKKRWPYPDFVLDDNYGKGKRLQKPILNAQNIARSENGLCNCSPYINLRSRCTDETCEHRSTNLLCPESCGCSNVNPGCPTEQLIIRPNQKGHGLYCSVKIKKYTIICEYFGREITKEQREILRTQRRPENNYVMEKGSGYIIGNTITCKGAYVNHSCAPNARYELFHTHDRRATKIFLVALRDIEPNSEITVNYQWKRSEAVELIKCLCGASTCNEWIQT